MNEEFPNGCSASPLQVHPLNWQKQKTAKGIWYIHYRFYDPAYKEYKYGMLRMIKGMNREKKLSDKIAATKVLIKNELLLLRNGFNPIRKKLGDEPVHEDTTFIKALWKSFETIRVSHEYKIGIKSVINGVEKAAKELKIEDMPVNDVSRKYIKLILQKCSSRPRWSARQHNYYRTALIILFKELIEMEAVNANPVKEVSKMKEVKKERLTLTREERTKIVKTLFVKNYNFYRLIQIFFHSGARMQELVLVKGKHVDLKNQNCLYTVKKGRDVREIRRPIKDIALPFWQELMKDCGPEDYLISIGLVPGSKLIRREQITRRWRLHVKKKLGINGDFYSLKHSNTTEMMDEIKDEKEVSKLTGHTSDALIVSIYDTKNKSRKDDRIKKVWNEF